MKETGEKNVDNKRLVIVTRSIFVLFSCLFLSLRVGASLWGHFGIGDFQKNSS